MINAKKLKDPARTFVKVVKSFGRNDEGRIFVGDPSSELPHARVMHVRKKFAERLLSEGLVEACTVDDYLEVYELSESGNSDDENDADFLSRMTVAELLVKAEEDFDEDQLAYFKTLKNQKQRRAFFKDPVVPAIVNNNPDGDAPKGDDENGSGEATIKPNDPDAAPT